jgi:hypothetical protein
MPPAQVDSGVIDELRAIATAVRCFEYRLAETRRFPVALYLAPQPEDSFAALTAAVFRAFPDYPPFEGKFATVVPHVTVAHADEAQLCEIEVELRIALASGSPLRARCSEMVLIENSSGRWEELQRFPLGPS